VRWSALCFVLVGCGSVSGEPRHSSAAPPPPVAAIDAAVQPIAVPNLADPGTMPWLGVGFERGTARVTRVFPESPADKAGIRVGDEVRELDGTAVALGADVVKRVGALKPGATVAMVLGRGGSDVPATAVLATRPEPHALVEAALVHRQAPEFSLPVVSGSGPARLADLAGHVVVVEFWATWCGPCEMAASHLRDLHAKYPQLRIVAISDETPEQLRRFVYEYKVPYTIARDAGAKVAAAYLVDGLPTTVVIGKDRVVRYVSVGAGNDEMLDAAIEQALK
jgi:peroxiredoxin